MPPPMGTSFNTGTNARKPMTPPTSSSLAPLWIGLGVVLVLGLGSGGYWYWSHRAHAIDSQATTTNPASPQTSTSAASVASTDSASTATASPSHDETPSLPDIGSVAVKDIAFDQYKADVVRGSPVVPDFAGAQKQYRDYRTRITAGAKEGVNFGGHYAIVTFGCGAGCQTGYVVDETNGDVHDLGFGGEEQMYLNLDGRRDSTLLKASYCDGKACRQEAATWDGAHFKTIARQSSATVADDAMGMNCPSVAEPAANAAASSPQADATATQAATDQVAQQQADQAAQQLAARVNAESEKVVQRQSQESGIDDAARQMLADGQVCFDRQDYTCAITNAGNALRIKPGYGAAESLRSRAQAAQSQAMNNIDIH